MNNKILILSACLFPCLMASAQTDDYWMQTDSKIELGMIPTQQKDKLTSSVSKITSDEITQSSARTIRNALFGKGLGLTSMQGTGAAWEEMASFNVRGLQSLSGSGVLILVDGFERSINDLTIEEVDAVYILKDAAAVALYGYRGVNGVISIVTKRGSLGKTRIGISYDHGFYMPKRMPKMSDSYTYALAMNEAFMKDGKSTPRYNHYELEAIKNGDQPYMYPNVDWWDETIGQTGHSNNYNITFDGGNKFIRYYTMLNLENNSGFFKNTDTNDGYSTQLEYSKANVRTNLDITLSPSTTMQVNLMGILAEHNRPGRIHSTIMNNIYNTPSLAFPIKTEDGIWGGNLVWGDSNPVAGLQSTGYSRSHTRTLYADAKLTQDFSKFVKGLSASARVGYDNSVTFWENRNKTFEYASDAYIFSSDGIPQDIVRTKAGKLSELGFGRSYGGRYYNFNFVGNIDYTREFGKNELFTSFIYHFDHQVSESQNNTFNRLNYYLYTHYGYDNRYMVDMTLGMSGSNRFPTGNKYNFSPVLSAAWLISKENFMNDIEWIDLLKLRASAGIQHVDYVPSWTIMSQPFGGGGGYFFEDNYVSASGTQEGRLPTIDFRAERAIKYNVGIDFSLFKSLNITADAYYQRRDNIMVTRAGNLSNVLGVAFSYAPDGIVDSKGIEIGIDYNKKINDWTITAGANFTLTDNKIINQNEEPKAEDYLYTTGLPIGQPFALEAIGFFKDENDIATSPKQLFSDVKPGDIKYKDQNKDGFIDQNDKVAMGYNTNIPKTYYSFNLGLEYKGFGFDALFQGVGGIGSFLSTASVYRPLGANNNNISQFYYDNRWTPENQNAKFPRLTSEDNDNNNQNSSIWYADASYLKLRHCELYYKLPKKLISKAKMSSAKIYFRGMDLLSINKMDVFDPEAIGIVYPQDWSLHLGLSVDF